MVCQVGPAIIRGVFGAGSGFGVGGGGGGSRGWGGGGGLAPVFNFC